MTLMVESLGSRIRMMSSVGLPLPMPLPAPPRVAPTRSWKRTLKRLVAPLALAACDLIEMTIEAAGFGLLLSGFLFTIYMLG